MDIKKDKKVRAAFTLDKEVVEALDDFSLSTGQSKSALRANSFKPAGLVPLVRVNSELGVIMVIAVS